MLKKSFGNLTIVVGIRKKIRGKKPVCGICKSNIIEGDYSCYIKSLGEYKREYHVVCIKGFAKFILDSPTIKQYEKLRHEPCTS